MIGIIGAGISGLVLGYELKKAGLPFKIIEQASSVGGWIKSKRANSITQEFGPNSLFTSPELDRLIHELRLGEHIVKASGAVANRFIVKNRRIKQLPSKPQQLLFNNTVDFKAKFSFLSELTTKPLKRQQDPTFEEFFKDHFSPQVYDYLVDPFLTGVYAGDGRELLVGETFPSLLNFEEECGSVIKGFRRNKTLNKRSIITFKNGLSTLTHSLSELLEKDILLGQNISKISFDNEAHSVEHNGTSSSFTTLVNTTSIENTIDLFNGPSGHTFSPNIGTVHIWLDNNSISKLPEGFGVLVPKCEYELISGIIFNGRFFQSASNDTHSLVTCIIGGTGRTNHIDLSHDAIRTKIQQEFTELFDIDITNAKTEINIKQNSIPQYNRQLVEVRRELLDKAPKTLFHCGNWVDGVSIPDRVKSAQSLSKKLVALLP